MRKILKTPSVARQALRANRGVASLPAILLFGGLIIEIAIAGAFLVFYLNNSVYGTRLANEALLAAQAGLDDAILKIILDKSCPNINCPQEYVLQNGSATAEVEICKDVCAGVDKTQITSVGKSFTKRKKLIAVLAVDQTSGKVSIESITDSEL